MGRIPEEEKMVHLKVLQGPILSLAHVSYGSTTIACAGSTCGSIPFWYPEQILAEAETLSDKPRETLSATAITIEHDECFRIERAHQSGVNALWLSLDAEQEVVGDENDSSRIDSAGSDKLERQPVLALTSGGDDGAVGLFRVQVGGGGHPRLLSSHIIQSAHISACQAVFHNRHFVASSGSDQRLRLWQRSDPASLAGLFAEVFLDVPDVQDMQVVELSAGHFLIVVAGDRIQTWTLQI